MYRKPNVQQTTSAILSLNKMTCEKRHFFFIPLNTTRGFGNTADVLHLMLCPFGPFGSNEASGADATHPDKSRKKNEHRCRNWYQSSRFWIKNKTKNEKNEAKKPYKSTKNPLPPQNAEKQRDDKQMWADKNIGRTGKAYIETLPNKKVKKMPLLELR